MGAAMLSDGPGAGAGAGPIMGAICRRDRRDGALAPDGAVIGASMPADGPGAGAGAGAGARLP